MSLAEALYLAWCGGVAFVVTLLILHLVMTLNGLRDRGDDS